MPEAEAQETGGLAPPAPAPGLSALGLKGWPFSVVPSVAEDPVWVGRPETRRKLASLLRSVARAPVSRIILLWAGYGQGKTHALRYLRAQAREEEGTRALYVATPKGIKSFVDIYRGVVEAALEDGVLDELGLALFSRHGAQPPTDLERALVRLVTFEEPETRSTLAWLKAEKVDLRSLREVGIGQRIESSADGIDKLDELIRLTREELGLKLILLLDEIQELGQLRPRQLDEAVGGLHKVFDRSSENLTLLLSFTTGSQDTIKRIIGETLYERRSEILTLPALDEAAGVELIAGLIEAWSLYPEKAPFPFEPDAIEAVVGELSGSSSILTPRGLIRAFDVVLREGDVAIEDGEIASIDASFAKEALAGSEVG